MNKKIVSLIAIGTSVLMLAACTQSPAPEAQVQPTTPAATSEEVMPNASISGQIDISDDAVTQREATMSNKKQQ